MSEYDPKTLKKIQSVEISILQDFIEICQEYNLEYFAVGGTALGAIRHGGFIPWDDDIDVALNRKDYDCFLKIAKNVLPDKYYILNFETNPNFPCMHTHICLKNTRFLTYDIKDFEGENGIFLDLFCYDNIADDNTLAKKQGTRAWFWNKLMIISILKEPTLFYTGIKKKFFKLIIKLIHFTLNFIGIKRSVCYKNALKNTKMYKDNETKRMGYLFNTQRLKPIINKADIYPTKKIKFESIEINVPNNIEKYLTESYGNYMELPPKEKQHNHKPYVLDFGEYE